MVACDEQHQEHAHHQSSHHHHHHHQQHHHHHQQQQHRGGARQARVLRLQDGVLHARHALETHLLEGCSRARLSLTRSLCDFFYAQYGT